MLYYIWNMNFILFANEWYGDLSLLNDWSTFAGYAPAFTLLHSVG